jgi:hypothetical protein
MKKIYLLFATTEENHWRRIKYNILFELELKEHFYVTVRTLCIKIPSLQES